MNDPEFIELRNRFFIGVIITLIFIVPLFFFFKNKLIEDEKIISKIRNNETITLLVVAKECEECKNYKKQLKDNNVVYEELNKDKDTTYEDILNELNMSYDDITSPTIIYIEDKKVIATLPNKKSDEEINSFITNYNLEGNRN